MPRINRAAQPSRVTLLTTVVILLLIAWTGMAVITIFRANLTRNETIETMQRAFNNQTLDLEQRIRDLEKKLATATGALVSPTASPAATPTARATARPVRTLPR